MYVPTSECSVHCSSDVSPRRVHPTQPDTPLQDAQHADWVVSAVTVSRPAAWTPLTSRPLETAKVFSHDVLGSAGRSPKQGHGPQIGPQCFRLRYKCPGSRAIEVLARTAGATHLSVGTLFLSLTRWWSSSFRFQTAGTADTEFQQGWTQSPHLHNARQRRQVPVSRCRDCT